MQMPETCSKCKTPLDADAVFCPQCAAPVNPRCPKCEKPISGNAKFCKYCAFDLSGVPPDRAERNITTRNEQPTFGERPFTTGIDSLLTDKYRAMSDSELMTMLRGDLSAHTEKTLSIAVRELETRKSVDWRDVELAKTRVKGRVDSVNSVGSSDSYPYYGSKHSPKEKADRLIKSGGITAGISALVFLWGHNYSSSSVNLVRDALTGDSTYHLASLCVVVGAMGFLIGLILLLVGIAQRPS
jgi:hypothetical protein